MYYKKIKRLEAVGIWTLHSIMSKDLMSLLTCFVKGTYCRIVYDTINWGAMIPVFSTDDWNVLSYFSLIYRSRNALTSRSTCTSSLGIGEMASFITSPICGAYYDFIKTD